MVRVYIQIFLLLLIIPLVSFSQEDHSGIKFQEGTWSEALGIAKQSGKHVFVDFYADWCKPCIWMEKSVFTDKDVGDYFNKNFVSIRIDAEHEEAKLVSSVGIEAFPTLAIFNSSGHMVLNHIGALDGSDLIQFGNKAVAFPELQQTYFEDPENIGKLVAYLEVFKSLDPEEASRLAAEGLKDLTEDQLKSDEGWMLISNFLHSYDSKPIQYVINNPQYYFDNYPEFGDFLGTLYERMIVDASRTNNPDLVIHAAEYEVLVRETLEMMDQPADYYFKEAESQYYLEIGDLDKYFAVIDGLVYDYYYYDWNRLSEEVVEHADVFFDDEDKMHKILDWSERALEIESNYHTNFARSYTYYMTGNNQKALQYANVAYELCNAAEIKSELDQYIVEIQQHMN